MMMPLDLGTVLVLHKTSLLAGAGTLMLLWLRAERPSAAALVAGAFGLLAAGAFVAGLGENAILPPYVWQGWSAALGVFGYTLLFLGMRRLDRRIGRAAWALMATPPVLAVGLFTSLFETNEIRALVFHLAATASPFASALALLSGRRAESLPARVPLAAALLACAAAYGLQIGLIVTGQASPATFAAVFAATMMLNFAIAALVVSFIRERREEMHRRVSLTDALTGAANRQGLLAVMPTGLSPGDAVAIFDLDHFKRINDRFGHAAGDHALASFARLAGRRLRHGESLARFGGEEFVLFLRGSERSRADELADAIRRDLSSAELSWNGEAMPITASAGVAVASENGPLDRDALLAAADAALYQAKAGGRNRVARAAAPALRPGAMPTAEPALIAAE